MILGIAASNLLMAVAFLVVNPSSWRIAGGRAWIAANFTLSAAFLLLALRGSIPPVASVLVGNSLLPLGTALQYEAFALQRGLQPHRIANGAVVAIFFIIYSIMFVEGSSPVTNIIVASGYFGAQWALVCLAFIRASIVEPRRADLLIISAFALSASVSIYRALHTAFSSHPTRFLFDPNGMQSLTFAVFFISTIAAAFGFIMLAKEDSDRELQRQATMDSLTGIKNRRAFMDDASAEQARCMRQGRPASLLLLDIDWFKGVNDTHGHIVGDQLLEGFARCVESTLREYDLFGRYGGEEFVVLLPETSISEAALIAERIRQNCSMTPIVVGSAHVPYTASIGVASAVGVEAGSLAQALKNADAAMYQAKAAGRNRVVQFSAATSA